MSKWIDLTMTYESGMPGFNAQVAKSLETDGWNAKTLSIYSHSGTHMDAPYHFGVAEEYIDEIPIHRLSGRAWKVEIGVEEDARLIALDEVLSQLPKWEDGDSLLIETGWSRLAFKDWDSYRNKLPRLSEELARWCVSQGVNILGVEPPSVADVNNLDELTKIHHILLRGRILIVEGLSNLDKLPLGPFEIFAFPLKIKEGDGAPARVLAKLT